MKIEKIKINSYGKINQREVEFKDGINVIYGKNESGKSTIQNFIFNSFYGISKNKKGKVFSDYEKYKPWDKEEFSGKIQYRLDSNEMFEIYRDFNKKNPKIFNENSEDISKQFNIDKKTGNEFFYEQTKVDEDLFLSTVGILQKEVELEKNNQNYLVQKLANLVGTGEDNVSFKKAMERINRRQLGEIGTGRSKEKPINLIENNIQKLEIEKENLENYQDKKYQIAEEENDLIKIQEELKNQSNYLKELKLLYENEKVEKEKIDLKERFQKENLEKIYRLEKQLNEEESKKEASVEKAKLESKNNEKTKNKLNKKLIILLVILLVINLFVILFINSNLKYIFLLTVPAYLVYAFYLKSKLNKKITNEQTIKYDETQIKSIQNQMSVLNETNENLTNEINNLKNSFNMKNDMEIEKIQIKYEKNGINVIRKNNLNEINYEIEKIQTEINSNQIELHKLKIDKENIEPKLDKLAQIEETLNININTKNDLEKLNTSMEIAKSVMEEAYLEMKENITPKFTQNLSQIISGITNNKYNKIKFNEENGLMVELKSGDYVEIDKLSTGTIDQLYLALRISMLDDLSEEKLPLFLDETFAYYDDERLKNILTFLADEALKRQIFIFTCSNREQEIFNFLNIKYNFINL